MYYQAGQEQFSNLFLAAAAASRNRTSVKFNLFESAFDTCDWLSEPTASWDELLDLRVRQLKNQNKPIVLFFSGGTDSLTIYQVFKRNNIDLDVIWVRKKLETVEIEGMTGTIELLKKDLEHTNSKTKVILSEDNIDTYRSAYDSPTWTIDKTMKYHFGILGTDCNTYNLISQQLGTDNYIVVQGLEKPRLHFNATGVYSYQDDTPYLQALGGANHECFFITPELPELHVKQSYLLLNYIKSKMPGVTNPAQFSLYNNFHRAAEFDWLEYSINGCGRFGDVNNSALQKKMNFSSKLIFSADKKFNKTVYSGRSAEWFNTLKDDPAMKNYFDGLMMVFSDPLTRSLFTADNDFYSISPIRSKHYKMNF
jgi:hypothetical protein